MRMTRGHFKVIAQALNDYHKARQLPWPYSPYIDGMDGAEHIHSDVMDKLAACFCDALTGTNESFDSERFIKAMRNGT